MPRILFKDAQDFFNNVLPTSLAGFPDRARSINAIYAFKISDEGGGEWTVDLTANPPTSVNGADGRAQCTMALTNDQFMAMAIDPNALMKLYFEGAIQVSGDPMLAMKVSEIIALATMP